MNSINLIDCILSSLHNDFVAMYASVNGYQRQWKVSKLGRLMHSPIMPLFPSSPCPSFPLPFPPPSLFPFHSLLSRVNPGKSFKIAYARRQSLKHFGCINLNFNEPVSYPCQSVNLSSVMSIHHALPCLSYVCSIGKFCHADNVNTNKLSITGTYSQLRLGQC